MKNAQQLKRAVLSELEAIAFSDFSDFVSLETVPERGQVLTVTDTALLKRKGRRAVCQIKAGTKGIEVKLYDKLKALELLGKSCGALAQGENNDDEVVNKLMELFEREDDNNCDESDG
ncbi:MAG: terminase small subunit [Huintestinicola sp.]